jgi:hypothetical protein
MLHACVERFDVMYVRGNILGWEEEVNAAYIGRIGSESDSESDLGSYSDREIIIIYSIYPGDTRTRLNSSLSLSFST